MVGEGNTGVADRFAGGIDDLSGDAIGGGSNGKGLYNKVSLHRLPFVRGNGLCFFAVGGDRVPDAESEGLIGRDDAFVGAATGLADEHRVVALGVADVHAHATRGFASDIFDHSFNSCYLDKARFKALVNRGERMVELNVALVADKARGIGEIRKFDFIVLLTLK